MWNNMQIMEILSPWAKTDDDRRRQGLIAQDYCHETTELFGEQVMLRHPDWVVAFVNDPATALISALKCPLAGRVWVACPDGLTDYALSSMVGREVESYPTARQFDDHMIASSHYGHYFKSFEVDARLTWLKPVVGPDADLCAIYSMGWNLTCSYFNRDLSVFEPMGFQALTGYAAGKPTPSQW